MLKKYIKLYKTLNTFIRVLKSVVLYFQCITTFSHFFKMSLAYCLDTLNEKTF